MLLDVKTCASSFRFGEGFCKSCRQVRAVDDVTFYINRGETLLWWRNGCGKTTTSRCILRRLTQRPPDILSRGRRHGGGCGAMPESKVQRCAAKCR